MAAKCPKCGRKLRWYNIKAECPDCGVSIPNYNWEARLEEDNKRADEKFARFYNTLNHLKYTVCGTKLRVMRLLMSILPAIGFILPWAYISSENDKLYFDLIGIFTDGKTTLDFFKVLTADVAGVLGTMFSSPYMFTILGFIFTLLSVVSIVVAFFVIFIAFKNFKTKAVWITDVISMIFAVCGAVMFALSGSALTGQSFAIGSLGFVNASGGVMWGIFVYIALLAVALTGNLLVFKADAKTADELENERLEKVRKAREALANKKK